MDRSAQIIIPLSGQLQIRHTELSKCAPDAKRVMSADSIESFQCAVFLDQGLPDMRWALWLIKTAFEDLAPTWDVYTSFMYLRKSAAALLCSFLVACIGAESAARLPSLCPASPVCTLWQLHSPTLNDSHRQTSACMPATLKIFRCTMLRQMSTISTILGAHA